MREDMIERRENDESCRVSSNRDAMRGFDRSQFVAARRAAGVSIGELGRISHVSEGAIRNWESGAALPQVDKLRAALKALHVGIERVVRVDSNERLLSDLRILAALTQPELAAKASMPTSSLAAVERAHRPLTDAVAHKLALALGLPVSDVRDAYERSMAQPPRTRST